MSLSLFAYNPPSGYICAINYSILFYSIPLSTSAKPHSHFALIVGEHCWLFVIKLVESKSWSWRGVESKVRIYYLHSWKMVWRVTHGNLDQGFGYFKYAGMQCTGITFFALASIFMSNYHYEENLFDERRMDSMIFGGNDFYTTVTIDEPQSWSAPLF